MNKLFLVFVLLLVSIGSVSALSSYATCTLDGNHYVCVDGMPNPATNFGTYGVSITGNFTFTSNSGSGTIVDAEDLSLSYNIPGGVEFKDAIITFSSGAGSTSNDRDGGDGGDVSLSFVTDKFKISNSTLTFNSGSGGDGDSRTGCTGSAGGDSGSIYINVTSINVLVYDSNISYNIGDAGDADLSIIGCSSKCAQGGGGNAGNISSNIGLTNSSNNVTSVRVTYDGGNGGLSQVYCDEDAKCRNGGSPSAYTFNLYGNTNSDVFVYNITNTSFGAETECDTDGSYDATNASGAPGQLSKLTIENGTFNNAVFNVLATSSQDSDCYFGTSANCAAYGVKGGIVYIYGDSVILNNSRIIGISGDGGDGTAKDIAGARCGGGGDIIYNFNDLNLYNTSQSLTIGASGTCGADLQYGGSGGTVSIYANQSLVIYDNNITFVGKDGCTDNSGAYGNSNGSSFNVFSNNVTFNNVYANLSAGGGTTGYIYGGTVTLNGTSLSMINSHIEFIGGNRGTLGDSGYGLVNFSSVNITNSYFRLHKGTGNSTGYQSQFITTGNSTSVFDNATISLTKNEAYGKNNTFNISNREVLFMNNSKFNYTGYIPSWSSYSDYVYINNATVQSIMQLYNRSTSSIIVRYNVSQVGNWTFNGANTGYTLAQYFSRINNVSINYDTIIPISSSSFNCTSDYVLGNSSVGIIYSWYVNDTLSNTGQIFSGSVDADDNLICNVRLNDTVFNLTSNDTEVINYGYPYNVVFSVDDEVLYNFNDFLDNEYSDVYSYCYQESANTSNQSGIDNSCSLNYSGSYTGNGNWFFYNPPSPVYDGSWSTSHIAANDKLAILYVNYSKPSLATNESLWMVKTNNGTYNNTINSNCWSQSILQFQLESFYNITNSTKSYTNISCYNGSSWYSLRAEGGDASIFEEAMYWYAPITNNTLSSSIDVGGFNRYIQYVCNDSDTNCTIPIVITSDVSEGIVNVTSFSLVYGTDNASIYDNTSIVFVVNSSQAGDVNITNLDVELLSDEETDVRITYNDIDYYMSIKYSEINVSIVPNGVNYWDVYPYSPTQQNVPPFGQKSSVPIFNLSYSANNPFYVYMRFINLSYPSCASTTFNSNSTNAPGWIITDNFTNIGTMANESYTANPLLDMKSRSFNMSEIGTSLVYNNTAGVYNFNGYSGHLYTTSARFNWSDMSQSTVCGDFYLLNRSSGSYNVYGAALCSKLGNNLNGMCLDAINTSTTIVFRITASNSTNSYALSGSAIPLSTALNRWWHICATKDGSSYKVYYNGVLNNSGTSTLVPTESYTGYISVGRYGSEATTSSLYVVNGSLDDVMLFNTTLNSSQINSLYNNVSPMSVDSSNLKLWLPFSNYTYNNSLSLWSWTDFNCSYSQLKVFYPQIEFKTLCTECVVTEDFYD